MKHILHIFRKDVTGLSRNLFALVIAGGLCIIPSLYAWFNIYSNWDPYANTSSLKVAVVSEDSGFSSKGSDPVNMGNQVVEQLHDNTGVGWVFPQDTDAALKGVYDGSYYAAIIIGDDFSRSLFDFLDNGMNHPSVTYYENSKKNAVATKITDTASSTLQQTINTEFINVAAQTALSGLESITQKDSSISGKLIDDMKTIQDNLSGYADTIATFQNGNASLSENLESMSALIPELQDILENSKDTTKLTQSALSRSVDNMTDQLDTTLAAMETISEQVQKQLDTAQNKITSDTQGASDALSAALDGLNSLLEQNHKLDDLLNKLDDLEYIDHNIIAQIRGQLEAISTLQDLAKNLIDQTSSIVKETPEIAAAKAEVLHTLLSSCLDKMTQTQQKYHTIASSGLSSLKITVNAAADSAYKSLENSGSQLNSLEQILLGTSKIALTANQTLGDTGTIISGMSDKIQLIFLNNLLCRFIMADLRLQLFGGKRGSVVLNLSHMLRQPGKRFLHLFFIHFLSPAHDFQLIDVLYINSELLLPVLHGNGGTVHSQTAPAQKSVLLPVQTVHHLCTARKGYDLLQYFPLFYISGHPEVRNPQLIQGSSCRQHRHHAGPVRIQICRQKIRSLSIFCRHRTEIRKCENAVRKERGIHPLISQIFCQGSGTLHTVYQPLCCKDFHPSVLPQRLHNGIHLSLHNIFQLLMHLGITI